MEEGVVSAEEQVGTVAPSAQIEEELPGALGHLGGISRLEAAPLGQGLWVRRWVAIRARSHSFRVGRPRPRDSPGWAVLGSGRLIPTAAWSNQSPRVPAKN